jgi:hypothetical protein
MNKRYLLADLSSARHEGIEYFLDSEDWPVREKEFHIFSNYIRSVYSECISNLENEIISDIALIENIFVGELINILHYNYTRNYCLENNIKLISGKEALVYLRHDWTAIRGYHPCKKSGVLFFIKRIAKNFVFNRHLPYGRIIKGILFGSKVVGIGSNDRLKQDFIIKNNFFCDNRTSCEFIIKGLKPKYKCVINKKEIEDYVSHKILTPFVAKIFDSESLFFRGVDTKKMIGIWINRFVDAYKIYQGLLSVSNIPRTLLVTEVARPYSKIITLAFQRRHCEVINVHHGNDSILLNQKWIYRSLLLHCNNYIVDTGQALSRLSDVHFNNNTTLKRKVKFISVDSNYYNNLRKKQYNLKKNKITIIGYPMNLQRFADDSYLFFHYKMGLEYKLAKIAKLSGFSVSYKAHPDRLNEVGNIMGHVSDEIVKQPFEDIWHDSGILVFTYVPTTVFCFALNLPIPIVLIDTEDTPWSKGVRELLINRVSILRSKIQNDTFIINKEEFNNAITESITKVNLKVSEEITG